MPSRVRGQNPGVRSSLLVTPRILTPDVTLAAENAVIERSIVSSQPLPNEVSRYDDPTIRVQDLPRSYVDPFRTAGAVGTVFFGGILRDLLEYNPDIADDKWLDVADMMYRSVVPYAITRCIMLPLLRGQWIVRPGSESDRDKQIAQAYSDNLFKGQTLTWRSELTQIMLFQLKYGLGAFEKCWMRGSEGPRLGRLAPRLARTLYRFYIDPETDEIDRIQQRVWVPEPAGVTGTWRFPVIPREKCLLFTYDREGNYVKGVSLYRHLYEDWYLSKNLKSMNAVTIERNGMGIPWFDEPPGAQETDRIYARQMLKQIHVHEQMFGTSPAGWQFKFQETHGGKDALPSIEYHDRQQFVGALATFATDTGGSFAKSQDLSTFFTESLYSFGYAIGETIDRELTREWVDFNVPESDRMEKDFRYPVIQLRGIDRRQMGTWLRGLAQLFQVGAINRDDDTENALRDYFDFPQLPVEPSAVSGGDITVDTESQGEAAAASRNDAAMARDGVSPQGRAAATVAAQPGAGDGGGDESLSEAAVAFAVRNVPRGVDPTRWRQVVVEEAQRISRGG